MSDDKSLWHQLLEARMTRRTALKGGLAAIGASVIPLELRAATNLPSAASCLRSTTVRTNLHAPFSPISPTTVDDLVLPPGVIFRPTMYQ